MLLNMKDYCSNNNKNNTNCIDVHFISYNNKWKIRDNANFASKRYRTQFLCIAFFLNKKPAGYPSKTVGCIDTAENERIHTQESHIRMKISACKRGIFFERNAAAHREFFSKSY